MATKSTLKTIWYTPDPVWIKIQPLLGPEKLPGTPGRPAVPFRRVLDGIIYVLRTGCQWKAAPKEFGSGSTLHRRFQQWVAAGVFLQIWVLLLEEYDQLRGIAWQWQSLDTIMTKAPLGGEATGPNPTDRAKSGTKRHVLSDQRGAPLAVGVTAANRHDMKAACEVLDAVVLKRPKPSRRLKQHLCLDKAYDFPEIDRGVRARGYEPHIRHRGEPPLQGKRRHPARRWVVERTHSWHNRYRRLLIRWEKKAENFLALFHLACAITIYRLTVLG